MVKHVSCQLAVNSTKSRPPVVLTKNTDVVRSPCLIVCLVFESLMCKLHFVFKKEMSIMLTFQCHTNGLKLIYAAVGVMIFFNIKFVCAKKPMQSVINYACAPFY